MQSHISDRLDRVQNLTICSIMICGPWDDFSLYVAVYVFGKAESEEYTQEFQQSQTNSNANDDVHMRHGPVNNCLVTTLLKKVNHQFIICT